METCFAVLVYVVDWLSGVLFNSSCGDTVVNTGVWLVVVFSTCCLSDCSEDNHDRLSPTKRASAWPDAGTYTAARFPAQN